MSRQHVVLVPGFVGFDALGQIRYYAGVSKIFRDFATHEGGARAVVHYFDNFPTASVATRAERLRVFLAKRFTRGEIVKGDEISLIGHSTGGLDIRRLLLDLEQGETFGDDGVKIDNAEIRLAIRRLVFLSVPHYGTNIADYVSGLKELIQPALAAFSRSLRAKAGPAQQLREALGGRRWQSDALTAVQDTLNETDLVPTTVASGQPIEVQSANERQALAELTLWLDHMASDFSAIDDLRSGAAMPKKSGPPAKPSPSRSPAHFSAEERQRELTLWAGRIATRSYATVVPQVKLPAAPLRLLAAALKLPLSFVSHVLGGLEQALPSSIEGLNEAFERTVAGLLERGAIPAVVPLLDRHPSLLFSLVYVLCASPGEPFNTPSDVTTHPKPRVFGDASRQPPATTRHDNDGIVNTQSMFWPYEAAAPDRHQLFLVAADHGDIVGQYDLRPRSSEKLPDRRHDGYDIFQSGSGFDQDHFDAVWNDIAKFVLTPNAPS